MKRDGGEISWVAPLASCCRCDELAVGCGVAWRGVGWRGRLKTCSSEQGINVMPAPARTTQLYLNFTLPYFI